MDEQRALRIELTHEGGYEFRLRFDWDDVPEVLLDEPEPLGQQLGPNASRLLAAAVANCLTASLLFCLRKAHIEPKGLKTTATGRYTRNAQGRLRLEDFDVTITLDADTGGEARFARCASLFEDYCVVTESVRHGIPVQVRVLDTSGHLLHESAPGAT